MKKIYLLASIILCSAMLFAQAPANRTTQTIVADVLAQMPVQQGAKYNNLMKDLSGTGEEGVVQLVKMMNPPGKGSNASVEYALSGLSHYVSGLTVDMPRLTIANAYVKALDLVTDREIKAFIIRQLEIIGKEESVAKLASYLNDEVLSGPAARALASINRPEGGKALLGALGKARNNKTKEDIILAIAQMQLAEGETPLKSLLGTGDEKMQKTLLYALSRVGSKSSLPELALLAEKANFGMEKTGANEAYIALLKRVQKQGDVKEVEKAAADLMKKASKAGQTQSREAALEVLMAAKPAEASKLLMNALKDSDKNYRNAALAFASQYANLGMYIELAKLVQKGKPEVKEDILNSILIDIRDTEKKKMIEEIRLVAKGDAAVSFIQVIGNLLDEKQKEPLEVRLAAMRVLSSTGDAQAGLALIDQLASNDPKIVTQAKESLASFGMGITSEVAAVIPKATDAGKIAALELLALRKANSQTTVVIEQINTGSPSVKAAAYTALRDVVSPQNIKELYSMLESAEPANIAPIQKALTSALNIYPQNKQAEIVVNQMEKVNSGKEYLYYPVLAGTGDPAALAIISDKFTSETGEAKNAAFQALVDWKGIEVAEKLYAIAKDASASDYSSKALDRYIQLASSSLLTGENRRMLLTNVMEIAKTDTQKNQILKELGNTGSFLGMVLAGQYLDSKPVQQAAANAVMTIALANKDFTGNIVEDLLKKVSQVLDNPDADYQKQAIQKHLNELPKEEGYASIFNGKDLSGWKGLVENPIARSKMKPADLAAKQAAADQLAKTHWLVQNGILAFDGKGHDNLCTVKQYGDFEMLVDWNLDIAGPEADAGVYLRGTPQVQIWDTARVKVGAQVGSGGLYNNQKNESKPLVVADNKLGEWNTFYIKMVGDRVTVKLNGVLVVDNVILENYWDRTQPIFPTEQIELQAHGSKVYYRNIYVKELERPEPFELSAQEKKDGYKVLFDGTNMHQWTGNTVDYILEDGCISMHPSKAHGGNLYTKDEYGNFIFRFEFQLTPGANNGLGIRTPMEGDAAYVGMELQILDNEAPIYKNLKPYQYHGSVYGIIPSERGHLKPVGEWNYQEVIANGDNIKITLNGVVILDGNIREATKAGTPDGKEHPGLFNKIGHIGFLGHGSPVKFKNIRIKELKP